MTEDDIFKDLGARPFRRLASSGRPAPHLPLRFDSRLFSIMDGGGG